MKVLEERALDVLRDSLIQGPEEGKKGSQYPVLQAYLGSDGTFVPVERIGGRFYSANSDAGFFLTGVGIPKDFPAKDKIKELVRYSIQLCDEAIRRECGFGEYSKPSS